MIAYKYHHALEVGDVVKNIVTRDANNNIVFLHDVEIVAIDKSVMDRSWRMPVVVHFKQENVEYEFVYKLMFNNETRLVPVSEKVAA